MFKNLISRIKEDDNPRLHRIPFMVIWVSAYGIAWFSMFMFTMMHTDLWRNPLTDWLSHDAEWAIAMLTGAVFGVMLNWIQGWAIRQRYGFMPRFWRTATIAGSAIAGYGFFMFLSDYGDFANEWGAGLMWFVPMALLQALVLFRVNRRSGLLVIIGLLAGVIAPAFEVSRIAGYNSSILGILLSAAIQSIGTGIIMLGIMANPREGIVPKRDSDEKAKSRTRDGLSAFSFIGFWATAYFMGWVTLLILMAIWFLTIGETDIMRDIARWIDYNAEWVFGAIFGSIIGFVSAIAQVWLMKQRGKTDIRHWILLSTIGWAIGGIGLGFYMENYSLSDMERTIALLTWFVVPALFQTIPMWRAMRGGWMWIATGIVTAIVAVSIESALSSADMAEFYALMFGGIAQAIITGATFILLKSQEVKAEQQTEVVSA